MRNCNALRNDDERSNGKHVFDDNEASNDGKAVEMRYERAPAAF
jgi:hypothetical protein